MPWLLKCGISWVWCLGSSSVVYHGFDALALKSQGIKPMIYHTWGAKASNPWYTTLEEPRHQTHDIPHLRSQGINPMIYHTWGAKASNPWYTTLEEPYHGFDALVPQVWYIMGLMPWLLKCGISWVWCLGSSSVVYHGFNALAPQVWYIMGLMPCLHQTHDIPHLRSQGIKPMIYHTWGAKASNPWYTTLEEPRHQTQGLMPWFLKCGISWVWCLGSSSVVYHGFNALAPQVWYIMGLMPWLLKCGISWV
jgi:hypothetical protein